MTAQIHDSILLQDRKLSIVGVNGSDLFNPLHFNLQPLPRITSCWRGFVCEYKIVYDQLLLNTLQVNLEGQGPAINGLEPSFSMAGTFNNTYNPLDLKMDFTGEILAGAGFIRELYVHMGFHPAWKYETVYELIVSQGIVADTRDISKKMAERRQQMTHQPPPSVKM